MSTLPERVRLFPLVSLLAVLGGSAAGAPPSEALDAYVKAYTRMGKAAALMFSHDKTRADGRAKMISTWADAQCKLLSAQAAWVTSLANAEATRAQTLQTLQKVRSLALDNDLKLAKTFYDKRKLYEQHQKSHARKRPTQQDVIRYSKVSVPERPGNFQVEPVRGSIYWPQVLLEEEFSDCRTQLNCLFAQRRGAAGASGSTVPHQVEAVTAEMREQLRSKIRQLSPAEYLAARKFLEGLAYEARFSARIDGVASN